MINKKYKEWTVLSKSENKAKNGTALYLCQCSCGKQQELTKWHLEQKTRSFACPNCSQQTRIHPIDSYRGFIGKVFGKWKVVKSIPRRKLKNGKFEFYFECRCDCGDIHDVRAAELKNGRSTQCRKCATKNNSFFCGHCGCISHKKIDLEKECELLGFCPKCDKFCCYNCNLDLSYHLTI